MYRSPRYYEVIGYTASDDTRDFGFFSRILHPDDRGRVLETIQSHVRGETAGIDFECRVIARDGTVRWMKVRGQVRRMPPMAVRCGWWAPTPTLPSANSSSWCPARRLPCCTACTKA